MPVPSFNLNTAFSMVPTADIPHLLEDYSFGPILGEGGFGLVVAGVQKRDQRPVAIKIIAKMDVPHWVTSQGQEVPEEVRTLRRLQHIDGVVQLLDYKTSANHVFVIMERLDMGVTLYELGEMLGSLDEDLSNDIFRQVVRILMEVFTLHSTTHNDIKLQNVMVDLHTLRVTIIDWGQASLLHLYPTNTLLGTQDYLPPEFYHDHTYRDPLQATIWSLGTTLFNLTHWGPPVHQRNQVLQVRPELSPEAADLIRGCLASDPARRLTMPQILFHPWMYRNAPGGIPALVTDAKSEWQQARTTRRRWRDQARPSIHPTVNEIITLLDTLRTTDSST